MLLIYNVKTIIYLSYKSIYFANTLSIFSDTCGLVRIFYCMHVLLVKTDYSICWDMVVYFQFFTLAAELKVNKRTN